MFIGHYGVAFAVKAAYPDIPMPVLMLATQAIDVVWCGLVLAKVETVSIDPACNPTVPLRMGNLQYSHGLPGAIGISIVTGGLAVLVYPGLFWVITLVAFSHWLIDFSVHDRHLPLWGNRFPVGLALWRHPFAARALEYALILGGAGAYFLSLGGGIAFWVTLSLAVMVQTRSFFGPVPRSVPVLCLMMLIVFAGMAALGVWMDAHIQPKVMLA